ncbi:electron transfer flavoprotein subunit alpha/FixB family protein [[Eubacterium] cellulosolvens]
MIFAEQRNGVIASIVYELIGKGRELSESLHEPLECILIGGNVQNKAKDLIMYGVDKVYVVQHPILANLKEEPYTEIISQISEENSPSILLIGATSFGRSIAPRIATKLKTGLTADCVDLKIDQDRNLLQIRPAYGGNILATLLCEKSRPLMATVRYKTMKKADPIPRHKGEISIPQINFKKIVDRTEFLEFKKDPREISIVEADVIVSGGKGLKNAQGFTLLQELAEELNGAVGASRAAVDEGWIDYNHQVGLSGRTVHPKIYIAVGISGAIQHLAGMQMSDVIIAINKNPNAPIFKVATLGIVGDLYDIVPKLVRQLKELQKKS